MRAGGSHCDSGCNAPLHLHPLFNSADVYGRDRPTRIAHAARDVRQPPGSLPVSERINAGVFGVPWFKHYRPQAIAEHAAAYRKVAENYRELLAGDAGNPPNLGRWRFAGRE